MEYYQNLKYQKKNYFIVRIFLDFFSNIKTLEFDYKASILASEIDNALIKEGKKIDVFDSLIAGTMLANGVDTILTRNKHFERIKGIKMINY